MSVCMYICCCENICSQSDDFGNAFEFLNEKFLADISWRQIHHSFLLFFKTHVKCCVFLFLRGCFLFRGGRMHSELIYYMCSRSVVYEELVLAFYYTKYA